MISKVFKVDVVCTTNGITQTNMIGVFSSFEDAKIIVEIDSKQRPKMVIYKGWDFVYTVDQWTLDTTALPVEARWVMDGEKWVPQWGQTP